MNCDNKIGSVWLLGLFIVLFIGLKFTENIDWSWWYVLMPIWLPLAIIVGIIIIASIIYSLIVIWAVLKQLTIFLYFNFKKHENRKI